MAEIEARQGELGTPDTVLGRYRYMNRKEVKTLQKKGMKALVATKAPSLRKHDFRPKKPKSRKEGP